MSRNRIKVAVALGCLAALVYALTAPPGITWEHFGEDGPEFAAIGICLGISHPTGYPLYALILRLATVLGGLCGFEPARAAGLVSQLAAGAAVAVAALLFMSLLRAARARYYEVWGGIIGAALFAAAPVWWGQATIIEVYPLHLCLTGLILLAAATWQGSSRRLRLLGFLLGLGFAHHVQTLLVLPAVALLVVSAARPSRGAMAGAALCGLIPLTLYLVLPLRSRLDPPLDWGNPQSLRQLLWVASGAQYRFRMFRADLPDVLRCAGDVLGRHLPDAFGWSALPLAAIGLVRFWRPMAALLLLFIVQLAWAVNYSIPDPDAYYLPILLALAGLIGGGAGWLLQRGLAGPSSRERGLALLALGLALSQALFHLPGTWRRNDLSRDRDATNFASAAIAGLPEHALVLSEGDGCTFSLWYEQVRRRRFDAIIVYRPLLRWAWCLENLRKSHPSLALPDSILPPPAMERELLAKSLGHRPVFTSYSDHGLARTFVHHPATRLFRVDTLRTTALLPTWPGMTGRPLPLEAIGNADWRYDPFTPGSRERKALFPGLLADSAQWGDVRFATPSLGDGWQPNCLTTYGVPDLRVSLPLTPEPTGGLALLLSAHGLDGDRPGPWAWLEVAYADGGLERRPVRAFREVWNHDFDREELARPEELETLAGPNALFMPLDPARTPLRLTIAAPPAMPSDRPEGIVVLAVTQLLASNGTR